MRSIQLVETKLLAFGHLQVSPMKAIGDGRLIQKILVGGRGLIARVDRPAGKQELGKVPGDIGMWTRVTEPANAIVDLARRSPRSRRMAIEAPYNGLSILNVAVAAITCGQG